MNLVMLPGLDGTGDLFKPFIEVLPEEINVFIISYPANIKQSYDELVELVLTQIPDDEFILLGESFSGYIAHQVVLRNPKNIKAVIFVASFLENPRPRLLGVSKYLPMQYLISENIPKLVIKLFLFGTGISNKIITLFRKSLKKVSPDVLSYRLQEITKITSDNKSCSINASYIQASNDKLVPKRCVDVFKRTYKNIRVFEINGSHFILQGNPLACLEVVINLYDL